ncbi:ketosynthase chain-length factor [Streptomyces sp. NPDC001139]
MTGRVLVTGMSALAPNGSGLERYWQAVLDGEDGVTGLSRFDPVRYRARLAGQITDLDPETLLPSRLVPQTDRVTRLALVAAEQALADARVDPSALPEYDMSVITSNAMGGFEFTHREIQKSWTQGPDRVSVYESFAWFYAANTGQISIRHGIRGPGNSLVAEQASGLDAIGLARRTIRRGTRLAVTGGVESALDPWAWVCHLASDRIDDGPKPYRPFDRTARGHVPGEGGALLILEDEHAAAERGAERVYGEVAGHASTLDPRPGSGRPPGLTRAIRLALKDAGLEPGDIDVVFADGSGIPELDRHEARAIGEVFGPFGVAVTAPKCMIGRLGAGGPPLDVVTALLCLRDGVIPPTYRTTHVPHDYGLDLVLCESRRRPMRTAMVLARGYGGFNAALVVKGAEW